MEQKLKTRCCIAGGGPAGIMLGFLLARAGVDVVVLEKHADFFRDFRGDTIHPSTIELMYELGLLDDFLKVPHQEQTTIAAQFNNIDIPIGDFTHLPVARPILAIMPQWDFLNFVVKYAKKYPSFHLVMEANVTTLLHENNQVSGVLADVPGGTLEVSADLVVGTDGRHSVVREQAALNVINTGAPIDVLWFRLTRTKSDPTQTFGRFYKGSIMVLIGRDDYWQCAYVIEKDGYEKIRERGIESFRKELVETTPFLEDRVTEIKEWSDIKLLSVAIDHLEKWYADGVLCIGDAAHAMSPIGGVGINLAIQDAVATANILYKPLLTTEKITTDMLRAVQKRREFPMRMIQQGQVFIQNGMIYARQNKEQVKIPLPFRLLRAFPILRRIPARIVGMGIRPEHIQTPEMKQN